MDLYRVWSYSKDVRCAEERYYIVLAPDRATAKELASNELHDHDSMWVRVAGEIHGHFNGPARVLGDCESGTWIWLGP